MLLQRRYLHQNVGLSNIIFDPSGGDKNLGRFIDFDLAKHVEFGLDTSTQDESTVCIVLESSLSVVVIAGLSPVSIRERTCTNPTRWCPSLTQM